MGDDPSKLLVVGEVADGTPCRTAGLQGVCVEGMCAVSDITLKATSPPKLDSLG